MYEPPFLLSLEPCINEVLLYFVCTYSVRTYYIEHIILQWVKIVIPFKNYNSNHNNNLNVLCESLCI